MGKNSVNWGFGSSRNKTRPLRLLQSPWEEVSQHILCFNLWLWLLLEHIIFSHDSLTSLWFSLCGMSYYILPSLQVYSNAGRFSQPLGRVSTSFLKYFFHPVCQSMAGNPEDGPESHVREGMLDKSTSLNVPRAVMPCPSLSCDMVRRNQPLSNEPHQFWNHC